ncbi:MAG TPA: right-handed parallel beta-helix repeat-containing protein [Verrucomicrobiota bacterium]|nr:right-handed parallel beta-helix repeat-containing protein [Verrucomicrobiota bacterium]
MKLVSNTHLVQAGIRNRFQRIQFVIAWAVCLGAVSGVLCQGAGGSDSVTPGPDCDWTVDAAGAPGSDFTRIQDAVLDPRVKSGDTICVRPGVYAEFVSTAASVVGEAKRLFFRSTGAEKPVVAWPTPSVLEPGRKLTHFVLEGGGGIRNFRLKGPGAHEGYVANGIAIMNPSVIEHCEIAGYDGGFLGFCAANAIDDPSVLRQCAVTGNGTGILTGDTEHVYEYNVICANGLGIDCATGSEARILNNVICSNTTHGIKLGGYMEVWAGCADIANNTLAHNGGHGIYMEWTPAADGSKGMPICPMIHNNIIAFNAGYAIEANTLYGPMTCRAPMSGIPGECELAPQIGGCYPQIRHNVIYANQAGLDPKDDPLNQFWWEWTLVEPPHESQRVFHVPNPVAYGGRQPQNRHANPRLTEDWYLANDSPCIDHGDAHLRPGATQKADPTGAAPKSLMDTGQLDIGYHHPHEVVVRPTVRLSVVPGAQGRRELQMTVEGAASGEQFTVMATDQLTDSGGVVVPWDSVTCWGGSWDVFILGEVPGANDAPQGFFWLR